MVKIAYVFPLNKLKITFTEIWSKTLSQCGELIGNSGKKKWSTLCTRRIAIIANPRNESTTSIRFVLAVEISIINLVIFKMNLQT